MHHPPSTFDRQIALLTLAGEITPARALGTVFAIHAQRTGHTSIAERMREAVWSDNRFAVGNVLNDVSAGVIAWTDPRLRVRARLTHTLITRAECHSGLSDHDHIAPLSLARAVAKLRRRCELD